MIIYLKIYNPVISIITEKDIYQILCRVSKTKHLIKKESDNLKELYNYLSLHPRTNEIIYLKKLLKQIDTIYKNKKSKH